MKIINYILTDLVGAGKTHILITITYDWSKTMSMQP